MYFNCYDLIFAIIIISGENADNFVLLDLYKQDFINLLRFILKMFQGVKKENTRSAYNKILDMFVDDSKARIFEDKMKTLMKSYEMLKGEPFLSD